MTVQKSYICGWWLGSPLALPSTRSAGASNPLSEFIEVRLGGLVLVVEGGVPSLNIFFGTEGRRSGDLKPKMVNFKIQ